MFDGIYGYFFGQDASQSNAENSAAKDANNEWIVVDQTSGRSSPVMVADLEMQELRDEDMDSNAGEKMTGQPSKRQSLRKMRKEIANQAKKQQVRDMVQRRQEVEKKLFEDSSSATDSSSVSSSPAAPTPFSLAKIEAMKPVVQRKKKCANIKQPKGAKGDNRRANTAK